MMTWERFEIFNNWLCLCSMDTGMDEPTLWVRYYPILQCWQGRFEDVVGRPAISSGGNGLYRCQPALSGSLSCEFQLVDGGQTVPIHVEQRPVPCPKSGGKKTRWHYGRWQKLLKTGWVNLEWPMAEEVA